MTNPFQPDKDPIKRTTHTLPAIYSWPATKHRFDDESEWAIRAAMASRRPLLVRGEPGLGKSQLARAAAHLMDVPFLYQVIDARTECDDLLYKYDAVSRLAQAQLLGAVKESAGWKENLAEANFIEPGPLWWAFNWKSAQEQADRYCRKCDTPPAPAGWKPGGGCVVLVDEIDKADSDVPNGLLESLGNLGFRVPLTGRSVHLPEPETGEPAPVPPLVIVTTNEERELPAAFLRRCMVLQMKFPGDRAGQIDFLLARARAHHAAEDVGDTVLRVAAEQLLGDREDAERVGPSRPGAAEYLDLITALVELARGNEPEQLKTLEKIRGFAFRKHPDESGS